MLVNHDKVLEGVIQQNLTEIAYTAYPSALVDKVKIDVGNMRVGDAIYVKDLDIASDKNVDLKTDPEAVVVMVTAVHAKEVPDEESTEE